MTNDVSVQQTCLITVIMFAIPFGDASRTEITYFSFNETVKLTNPLKPLTCNLKYGLLKAYGHL